MKKIGSLLAGLGMVAGLLVAAPSASATHAAPTWRTPAVLNITSTSADLDWTNGSVTNITRNELGTDTNGDGANDRWNSFGTTTYGTLTGLQPCTTYSTAARTYQGTHVGAYSTRQTFKTTGCTTTPPPTTPPPTTPPPTGDGTTAAATQSWGAVVTGDEFNYTGVPDAGKWSVYNSAGHAGNGLRSPGQVSVNGTEMVMKGTADGTTAGMSAKFANQKYGRWEARMKGNGDNEYHMVGILWPTSENWPCDGEVDYAETTGRWDVINFFHHYSCENKQTSTSKPLDVTQYHNYAVDWSPSGIVGYVDGVKWFEDNDPTHQPPGAMRQTLQLDWFPDTTTNGAAEMRTDWVRVYAPAGTTPTTPPTTPTTPPTTPPSTGESVDFAVTGDMNPSGTTSTTSNSGKNAASIKAKIQSGEVDYFIGAGDFQYTKGTCAAGSDSYQNYHYLWGAIKSKTLHVSGPNHDVEPGLNDDLDKYMNGDCPGTFDDIKSETNRIIGTYRPNETNQSAKTFIDSLDWYSVDKGNWHILFAPSATWRYNATRAAQMTAEMESDLSKAKAAGKHLAVVYHDPYYTSSTSAHGPETDLKPWVDAFNRQGVKITMSGSQHNYERLRIGNMTVLNVSTGGISLRTFTNTASGSQTKFSDTWGHVQIRLNADGSYAGKFVPTSGGMRTDAFSVPAQ